MTIKECPCCASTQVNMHYYNGWYDRRCFIECLECKLRTGEFFADEEDKCIDAWNRRAPMDELEHELRIAEE